MGSECQEKQQQQSTSHLSSPTATRFVYKNKFREIDFTKKILISYAFFEYIDFTEKLNFICIIVCYYFPLSIFLFLFQVSQFS